MNSTELIRAAGQACFGPQWQSQLSYYLGTAARTVRRWASGDSIEPHADNWAKIAKLMRERIAELNRLVGEVEKRAAGER